MTLSHVVDGVIVIDINWSGVERTEEKAALARISRLSSSWDSWVVLSLLSSKGAKGPLERDMGTMGGRELVLGRSPSVESHDLYNEVLLGICFPHR